MEDALSRLHRAIDYALLATVSGSPQQRGQLYARLACALTTQGSSNGEDGIVLLPNYEHLSTVLPIVVQDGEGRRRLHHVWNAPEFIAPAVAALAILFDRMVDPSGASAMSLTVSRRPDALYGYRIETFSAGTVQDGNAVPMTDTDWMRVSISLAGAALAFVKDISVMRFAPCYLRSQAEGTMPEGSEPLAKLGQRPYVSVS